MNSTVSFVPSLFRRMQHLFLPNITPGVALRPRVLPSLRHWHFPEPPPLQPLLLWQTLTLAWLCGLLAGRWPLAAALSCGLLFWADNRLRRLAPCCACIAVFALAWTVCLWQMPLRPSETPAWAQGTSTLDARVQRVQGLPDGRWRILLHDVRPVAMPGAPPLAEAAPLPGNVAWTWDSGEHSPRRAGDDAQKNITAPPSSLPLLPPLEGQRVRVRLPLRSAEGFRNPGTDAFILSGESQGVFWRLWSRGNAGAPEVYGPAAWGAAARQDLRITLEAALGGAPLTQGQAFLPALLFGDRSHLTHRTTELMAQASLAHSLALSGQHLALAAVTGALVVHILGSAFPLLYLRLPRIKFLLLAGLPPAAFYLWMGGAPASLLRAFCMLALLTGLVWKNRVTPLGDLLVLALLGITAFWPLGVFDTGLQLSALCMAALAISMPLLRRMPVPAHSAPFRPLWCVLRRLAQILCISLIIQIALLPFSLLIFGFASPWFALNVLWLPVLGLWVLPLGALGLALAAAGAAALAHGTLWLAALPCDALLAGLEYMARHGCFAFPALLRPHWTTLLAWVALLAAVALLPGRAVLPRAGMRLAVAGALLLLLGPLLRLADPWDAPLRLTLLDVGQGQAVALHLPGGQRLLVDGGGSASPRFDPGRALVAPTLTYNQAPRLHAAIASHPDTDHMGGLAYLLTNFDVRHFFHNGELPHTEVLRSLMTGIPGQVLHAGMVLDLPGATHPPLRLEVLHPPQGWAASGNDNSLILRLVQGNTGLALLPGDAEQTALRHVLASGVDVRAQVLVLPHHGSRSSLMPEFYDAVRPRMALASCGRDNRFGYPSKEVAAALAQRGIPLRVTAHEGYIELSWDAAGNFMKE